MKTNKRKIMTRPHQNSNILCYGAKQTFEKKIYEVNELKLRLKNSGGGKRKMNSRYKLLCSGQPKTFFYIKLLY